MLDLWFYDFREHYPSCGLIGSRGPETLEIGLESVFTHFKSPECFSKKSIILNIFAHFQPLHDTTLRKCSILVFFRCKITSCIDFLWTERQRIQLPWYKWSNASKLSKEYFSKLLSLNCWNADIRHTWNFYENCQNQHF